MIQHPTIMENYATPRTPKSKLSGRLSTFPGRTLLIEYVFRIKRLLIQLFFQMNSSKARSRALQEKKPQTYVGRGLSGSNGSQISVGFPQQSVGNIHENRSPEDSLDDDLSEMLLQYVYSVIISRSQCVE